MSSDQFLDMHVDLVLRASNFFPEVLLKMSDDKEKTCPFLTELGCSIYSDRPDTCRTFPVEQGVYCDAAGRITKWVHFFRPPDFCLGQHENKVWTIQSWAQDQGAVVYNKMTARWSEIKRLFQENPWGPEGPEGRKAKMAFMATYNVDQFRNFLFNSTFLKRYVLKPAIRKKIRNDDVALMTFGFEWVKFFVWGRPTNAFKPR